MKNKLFKMITSLTLAGSLLFSGAFCDTTISDTDMHTASGTIQLEIGGSSSLAEATFELPALITINHYSMTFGGDEDVYYLQASPKMGIKNFTLPENYCAYALLQDGNATSSSDKVSDYFNLHNEDFSVSFRVPSQPVFSYFYDLRNTDMDPVNDYFPSTILVTNTFDNEVEARTTGQAVNSMFQTYGDMSLSSIMAYYEDIYDCNNSDPDYLNGINEIPDGTYTGYFLIKYGLCLMDDIPFAIGETYANNRESGIIQFAP